MNFLIRCLRMGGRRWSLLSQILRQEWVRVGMRRCRKVVEQPPVAYPVERMAAGVHRAVVGRMVVAAHMAAVRKVAGDMLPVALLLRPRKDGLHSS